MYNGKKAEVEIKHLEKEHKIKILNLKKNVIFF